MNGLRHRRANGPVEIGKADRDDRLAELEDSERRLRAAVRLTKLGYYIWDIEARRNVHCNEEFAAIHGMTVEEYLSDYADEEHDITLVHPDDRQIYAEALRRRHDSGEPLVLEYRIVGKDGVTRHVREVESSEPVRKDKPFLMEGTLQDVTEFKKMERSLAESERTYRGILENMADTYYRTDLDGRVQMLSRSAEVLFGCPVEELLGRDVRDLHVSRDARDAFLRALEEAGGSLRGYDSWLKHKDGHAIFVSTNARYVHDENGAVIGIEGTIRDLTERRKREEANAWMGRILEGSLNELYVFGSDSLRFIMANRGARENTGYSIDELKEMAPYQIKRDFSREEFSALIAPLVSGEKDVLHVQARHFRKDGSDYPVRARLEIVRSETEPVIFVAAEDLSEQIETRKQLIQAQKMEAVGQLTGGVAHDFNNLLAVIQGNAELLREEAGNENELVTEIVKAAQRGAELTQRLLMYSRRQPLWPETVNLCELVGGMLPMLQRSLGPHYEFRVSTPTDARYVTADPSQVENAILNLALNARDAMKDGGVISISSQRAEPATASDGPGFVVLSVGDEGEGMDGDTLDRAFEPFFSTKGVGKGSGLGLSMVYGFAEKSGGKAVITSKKGRGTRIDIHLPAAEPVEAVPARNGDAPGEVVAEVEPMAARGRILVIEDEASVGRVAERILVNQGYRVVVAPDANAAARVLVSGDPIDLVLSDVVLKGDRNGPDFIREARQQGADLKVVFMSGYPAEILDEDRSLANGDQFLAKPFLADELLRVVQEALE
jgi:PAS domain S-box-containing protein